MKFLTKKERAMIPTIERMTEGHPEDIEKLLTECGPPASLQWIDVDEWVRRNLHILQEETMKNVDLRISGRTHGELWIMVSLCPKCGMPIWVNGKLEDRDDVARIPTARKSCDCQEVHHVLEM